MSPSKLRPLPEFREALFIALSGFADQQHLDEAGRVTFDEYLIKPLQIAQAARRAGNRRDRLHDGLSRPAAQSSIGVARMMASRSYGAMASMRFQFSILTMLVCTAAMAVAMTLCLSTPIRGKLIVRDRVAGQIVYEEYQRRPPTNEIILLRMTWAGPLAVFVALCLLWMLRRITKRFIQARAVAI